MEKKFGNFSDQEELNIGTLRESYWKLQKDKILFYLANKADQDVAVLSSRKLTEDFELTFKLKKRAENMAEGAKIRRDPQIIAELDNLNARYKGEYIVSVVPTEIGIMVSIGPPKKKPECAIQ